VSIANRSPLLCIAEEVVQHATGLADADVAITIEIDAVLWREDVTPAAEAAT
jgi:hypothetical protein